MVHPWRCALGHDNLAEIPELELEGPRATPDPLVFHVALPAADLDSCRLDTQSACAAEDETVIAKEVVRRGPPFVAGRKTCRPFNLVVAFERTTDNDGNLLGRGVAESSFHHFADYNWDSSRGAPSFVIELEGTGMKAEPRALQDIRRYVSNLAYWLAPANGSTG